MIEWLIKINTGLVLLAGAVVVFLSLTFDQPESVEHKGVVAGAYAYVQPTITLTPTPTPVIVTKPVHITIPSIHADAAIVPVGVTEDNTMETPQDFGTVGWYTGGPKPGEIAPQSAIINGHFDTSQGAPAIFYRLGDVQPGNEIIITSQTDIRYVFAVKTVERYPWKDFPAGAVYGGGEGIPLKLITCDGVWNSSQRSYSKRLVVTATFLRIEKFIHLESP